jgi:hypothetical protein
VHDFAATAEELPDRSSLVDEMDPATAPPSPLETELARKLGALIATDLVQLIRDMGLPAEHAVAGTVPQVNDIVIRGCLVSFDEGDAEKRLRVGFGAGSSEVNAAAEGLQVTAKGLRVIGSGRADATGGKTPGTAVGLVGLIATKNPAGLIISGVTKRRGEKTGSSKVEGRARQIAEEMAEVMEARFKEQGWVH